MYRSYGTAEARRTAVMVRLRGRYGLVMLQLLGNLSGVRGKREKIGMDRGGREREVEGQGEREGVEGQEKGKRLRIRVKGRG